MQHMRRLFMGLMSGLILTLVLGGAALPAAAASSSAYYVDDTPGNNGKTHCPATPYTDIASAINAINSTTSRNNVKLTICPGDYSLATGQSLYRFTNLTIRGLGSPAITMARGFTGIAFDIQSSSKVTVTGLSLDGRGELGTSSSAGIRFIDTNGTISKNFVSDFHQPYLGPPPYVSADYYGIFVWAPNGPQAVTVQQNSVYDTGAFGIWVRNPGKTNIVRNRVEVISNITPAAGFIGLIKIQAGILLAWSGPGGKVTGNQVQGTWDPYSNTSSSRHFGILIYETSGTRVTSNTVRGMGSQIAVLSFCETAGFANASANIISNNKLYDATEHGVSIEVANLGVACGTGHADFNVVKDNKFYNSLLGGYFYFGAQLVAYNGGVGIGNVVKGNTFAGFLPVAVVISAGMTSPVLGPNKILAVPPTGPLNAPPPTSEPVIPVPLTVGSMTP